MGEEVLGGEELLREEVSDGELRELLSRLGQDEMGGSGAIRVGDVAEATGSTPETIGRMLAVIRKEQWERGMELRQEALEKKVERQGRILSGYGYSAIGREEVSELTTPQRQRIAAVGIMLFFSLLALGAVLVALISAKL